jgi:hypothetical protein
VGSSTNRQFGLAISWNRGLPLAMIACTSSSEKRGAPLRGRDDQKAVELVDPKTFTTGVLYLTYQLTRS